MSKIDLENIANGTFNLVLDEVGYTAKADTYYFAIDNHFEKGVDGTAKVLRNLKQLISSWESGLKEAFEDGFETIYLPFDFSDQYIGFLKVDSNSENGLRVEYGFSEEVRGYAFSPAQIKCLNGDSLKKYGSLSDTFESNRDTLKKDLAEMQAEVDQYLLALPNTDAD